MARCRTYGALVTWCACLALATAGCRVAGGATRNAAAVGAAARTGVGVTSKACPHAVHPDHGCIYLGTISDLTAGPFAALTVSTTEAQKAFWARVNAAGGIGGYDIDVTTYVRDNKYNPQLHSQAYQEIKGKVLALAQTQGSPTTAAIIGDMRASDVVGVAVSQSSSWAFEDVILESGTNYCFESMNSVDYGVAHFGTHSVMAVHYPGDYGNDAATGARVAAKRNGLPFSNVETAAGQESQAAAVDRIVAGKPDLVMLSVGPIDAAVIVGQSVARGFAGRFIGSSPTWSPALLRGPAAGALLARYLLAGPWQTFTADTPGHRAMRAALGPQVKPNDGYTAGWVTSYPLEAALVRAVRNRDLTRAGLLAAVRQLDSVDYQGMLPAGAGDYRAGPNGALRQTLFATPDRTSPTGITGTAAFFTGATARQYKLGEPCSRAAAR